MPSLTGATSTDERAMERARPKLSRQQRRQARRVEVNSIVADMARFLDNGGQPSKEFVRLFRRALKQQGVNEPAVTEIKRRLGITQKQMRANRAAR